MATTRWQSSFPQAEPHRFAAELDVHRYIKTNKELFEADFKANGVELIRQIYAEHGAVLTPEEEERFSKSHEASITGWWLYPGGGKSRWKVDDLYPYNNSDRIDVAYWVSVKYRGINDGDCVYLDHLEYGPSAVIPRLFWPPKLSYASSRMNVDLKFTGKMLAGVTLTFSPREGQILPPPTMEDVIIAKLRIDALPYDILVDMLSRLTPNEITGLCHSSVRYQGLCRTDGFWEDLIAAQGWTEEVQRFPPMSPKDAFSVLQGGTTAEILIKIAGYLFARLRLEDTTYIGPLQLLVKFTVTNISEFSSTNEHFSTELIGQRINETRLHVDAANYEDMSDKLREMIEPILIDSLGRLDITQSRIDLIFGWEDGRMSVHLVFTLLRDTDHAETEFSSITKIERY